ncbi:MAG TPA: tRNA (N6-threonylcarbamoyladenosine(37)-N6)-methyltransferase TrmO [Syntrophobacteraceae bacterium]|nr:tRNA (N6-threonylcarbamoyladenosine(37)-N6)-methyltransferase TrmO [Syntrophobacteraceae bacterium]
MGNDTPSRLTRPGSNCLPTYVLRPVGTVRSCLKSRDDCPRQGFEGAPDAWLEFDLAIADALDGLTVGQEILLFTWLHQANRDIIKVHPRGDSNRALCGVFSTRAPDRPNPIGLHRVEIMELQTPRLVRVGPLEALDGTPIIDIKSVIREPDER